jgi:hypothetical protein
MRPSFALAVLALACLRATAQAQVGQFRHELRAELGPEYDSNPTRAEQVSSLGAPMAGRSALSRLVLSASGALALGRRLGLAAQGGLAGKRFVNPEAHGEDVLVAQAGSTVSLRLAARTSLSLAGTYYDAFQRGPDDRRDFRSGAPSLRFDQGFATLGLLSLGGGHRWFSFKSDSAYSFAGPTAFVRLRHTLPGDLETGGADWELGVGGALEWRGFSGPACERDLCAADPARPRHSDRFWLAHAEITRTATVLLGAGAALHVNQSNSYGEALVRGAFHLRGVVPLPWELSLSARAEVVVTRYADSLPLTRDPEKGTPRISIEDESRSTLRLEMARPLCDQVEIGGRYVWYTSVPSSGPVDFRRHTLLLYLAILHES